MWRIELDNSRHQDRNVEGLAMKCVDDFRLVLGNKDYVPIMIGGMGVDISTSELALEAARLGGIGHISDAMVHDVSDRKFDTTFVKDKAKTYKFNINNLDKSLVKFDMARLAEATINHVRSTMEAKKGDGLIFVNCMEKLTMNAPRETLRTRLSVGTGRRHRRHHPVGRSAPGFLGLIADHPRFRDAKLGIIVSSRCALQLFLRKNASWTGCPTTSSSKVRWPAATLASAWMGRIRPAPIMDEMHAFLRDEKLAIPLIAAGGIFTGTDAVGFLEKARAACRWRRASPSRTSAALPDDVKQEYARPAKRHHRQRHFADRVSDAHAQEHASHRLGHPPGCESYGYLLDGNGNCS
jgi:hypothetical protein